MVREATSCDLKDLVAKFIPEAIGKDIEKSCQGIYPLQVRGRWGRGATGERRMIRHRGLMWGKAGGDMGWQREGARALTACTDQRLE